MGFRTWTAAMHTAQCEECGKTFSSTDPDHVGDWMHAHVQETGHVW